MQYFLKIHMVVSEEYQGSDAWVVDELLFLDGALVSTGRAKQIFYWFFG